MVRGCFGRLWDDIAIMEGACLSGFFQYSFSIVEQFCQYIVSIWARGGRVWAG